jgi:opacity protein-like surface antigen
MRKVILLAAMMLCLASASFAQDRAKPEFFAGFSVGSLDTGLGNSGLTNAGDRETTFGFETSGTGYFNKSFGIEGNFDGHFKHKTFSTGTLDFRTNLSTFNFMAGPHVRFGNTESKVTPFVHALAGGNHSRITTDASSVIGTNLNDSATDFALKLGGGVDFAMSQRIGLRLAADYNPVFERGDSNATLGITADNNTRHDAVFSIGVVIK